MRKLPLSMVAVFLLGGCGTVSNLSLPPQMEGRQPYGGVRQDIGLVRQNAADAKQATATSESVGDGVEALLAAVDVPLSVVGDTLALPYTVPSYLLQPTGGRSRPAVRWDQWGPDPR
jgi:uncharacterized protein YceK